MSYVGLLALTLCGAPPAQVVDDDAMLWVELPALGASLQALEHSAFAALLPSLLPRSVARTLAEMRQTQLLATATREDGTGVAVTVLLDAAGALEPWQTATRDWFTSQGFRNGTTARHDGLEIETLTNAHRHVLLFSGRGRAGWSTDPARAAAALTPSANPLSRSASFVALRAASPAADLRARLDVQSLYGLAARQANGPVIAGVVRRIGLDRLQAIDLIADVRDRETLVARATLHLPKPWDGLPVALGPPIAQVRPAEVPADALSYARLSLIPARVWLAAERLCSFLAPLETTLARTQVDSIERQLGKTIVDAALGFEPRVWSLYRVHSGGRQDTVLVAEVADAAAARVLAESIVGLLPGLLAGVRVSSQRHRGSTILTVQGVALAFTDRHVVVASSAAAAREHLSRRGKAEPLAGAKVVAHGMHDDTRATGRLRGAAQGVVDGALWAGTLFGGGVTRARLAGSLGRTRWQATTAPAGLEVTLTTTK